MVGGWPALIGRSMDDALVALRGHLDETRRADLLRLDGVRRDPENVERVLRSVARHVATSASAPSIAADIGGADGPIDYHTVLEYTNALTRLFVIEDLPAWSPALRSRSAVRAAPTRHFVDPSLAVAALGTGPERLIEDVKTLGLDGGRFHLDIRVARDRPDGDRDSIAVTRASVDRSSDEIRARPTRPVAPVTLTCMSSPGPLRDTRR